jgi:hypothetical protein
MLSSGLVTGGRVSQSLKIPGVVQNDTVKFRSHITRPLDPTNPWNRAVVLVSVLAGVVGAILTVVSDRDVMLAIQAGGTSFLSWAVVRELDPDRQASAIVAGVGGGAWALMGEPTALLPFVGLLMISRLLVETTGRRPLATDLAGLAVVATVISYTPLGWVMGFGLGISIYVDDRMAEEPNRQALLAALAAGVGSSVVVTLVDALPGALPSVRPLLAALIGLLALIAVVREPVDPVSFVDSRSKKFLRRDRLQVARSVAGVLLFIAAFFSGESATAVVPMAFCLLVALASTEVERVQRAHTP